MHSEPQAAKKLKRWVATFENVSQESWPVLQKSSNQLRENSPEVGVFFQIATAPRTKWLEVPLDLR